MRYEDAKEVWWRNYLRLTGNYKSTENKYKIGVAKETNNKH